MDYIRIILAIVVIEAITNIITKSELFRPVRAFFFEKNKWIHDLLDCGYCTSVWIGIFAAIYLTFFRVTAVEIFALGIVLHRLSNMFHFMVDWLAYRRGQGKNS
jgi:hypothetical protein